MTRLPRVVYWNNIPSPYVVGRFNAVARRSDIDFQAWFNAPRTPRTTWNVNESEWEFNALYVPRARIANREFPAPARLIRETRPDLLVCLYNDLSFLTGALAGRACANRLALRVLPTYDSWVKRTAGKELLKHLLFRGSDAVKVPGPDGAAQAHNYGMPLDRIYPVTQSVDVSHYSRALEVPISRTAELRQRLGVGNFVFLYVGRLWKLKGVDILLSSFHMVRESFPNASLLLLGAGPDRDEIARQADVVGNVVIPGFIQRDELIDYYALADAFVFPTLGDPNGVVIEEAMCAGLPVIASDAAGDIRRRVEEGVSGFVVPAAQSAPLAERMTYLAANQDTGRVMGRAGHNIAIAKSHEHYAEDFAEFVRATLSNPKRSNFASRLMSIAGATGTMALAGRTGHPTPVHIGSSST